MRQDIGSERQADHAEPPARDEAAALAATGGDANLAAELLATLLKGLPADLETLADCLRGKDWPRVAETAHRMRGATSYCGVPALDAALAELERAAKAADAERILRGVLIVEREAERLRRWTSG